MGELVEVTRAELGLILEALDDAAFYRETRSRVLQSAAREFTRRSAVARVGSDGSSDAAGHRHESLAYAALAGKLKREL